jgi:hypothetical protein
MSTTDALLVCLSAFLAFAGINFLLLVHLLRYFRVDFIEFFSGPTGNFPLLDRRVREETRLRARRGQLLIDSVDEPRLMTPLQDVLNHAVDTAKRAEEEGSCALGGGLIVFGGQDKPSVMRLAQYPQIKAFAREWNGHCVRLFALGVLNCYLRV